MPIPTAAKAIPKKNTLVGIDWNKLHIDKTKNAIALNDTHIEVKKKVKNITNTVIISTIATAAAADIAIGKAIGEANIAAIIIHMVDTPFFALLEYLLHHNFLSQNLP